MPKLTKLVFIIWLKKIGDKINQQNVYDAVDFFDFFFCIEDYMMPNFQCFSDSIPIMSFA